VVFAHHRRKLGIDQTTRLSERCDREFWNIACALPAIDLSGRRRLLHLYRRASAQLSPVDQSGVKHFITAAIAPAPIGNEPEPHITGLQVRVRISDHARETQYFGDVPVIWPEFSASKGAPEQRIWEDQACHQRRGLPKATVLAIEGTLATEERRLAVSARRRHIGQKVPSDEIRQAQSLLDGRDTLGRYLAFQTETMQSHLILLLKIYVADCKLR
jgi:hypothetical protein